MHQYYLINPVTVGGVKHLPGTLVDVNDPVGQDIAGSGALIWPYTDPIVAAAAARANFAHTNKGASETDLEQIMTAAIETSQKAAPHLPSFAAEDVGKVLTAVGAPNSYALSTPTGGGGDSTTLVYRPGDPLGPVGNVYTEWGALAAAAALINQRKDILVDCEYTFAASVPPGAWQLGPRARFLGFQDEANLGTGWLQFEDGASLVNPMPPDFLDVSVVCLNTAPLITAATADGQYYYPTLSGATYIYGATSAPFWLDTGIGGINLFLDGFAGFGGVGEVFTTAGSLFMESYGASLVGDHAFSGATYAAVATTSGSRISVVQNGAPVVLTQQSMVLNATGGVLTTNMLDADQLITRDKAMANTVYLCTGTTSAVRKLTLDAIPDLSGPPRWVVNATSNGAGVAQDIWVQLTAGGSVNPIRQGYAGCYTWDGSNFVFNFQVMVATPNGLNAQLPATARVGDTFFSTQYGKMFVWDGTRWAGDTVMPITNATVNALYGQNVLVDPTGGIFDVKLPKAAGFVGQKVRVTNRSASPNHVTVIPNGAETINGAATLVMATPWQSVGLQSDGTNWMVI